jgi:hypothetical protein
MGSTVDPRLFVQDFSTINQSSSMVPQAIAAGVTNIASSVAGGVKSGLDEMKQNKATLKAGATMIDAASKLFPSYADMLGEVGTRLKDENTPLYERAAEAAQMASLIDMMVGESRWKQEFGLQQQKFSASQKQQAATQDPFW